MDGARFDHLTKSVAGASRRSLLKAAVGTLLGGALASTGRRGAAAAGRHVGEICRKHGDCASGVCGPKDATGRQYCVCATAADCPAPPDACTVATCTAGTCSTAPRNCAAELPGDQCNDVTCDPITGCSLVPLTGPACDDGDACTTGETCRNGVCTGGTTVACPVGDVCLPEGGCQCTVGNFFTNCGSDTCCTCVNTTEGLACARYFCGSALCEAFQACSEDNPSCPAGTICVLGACSDGSALCIPLCGNA